MWTKSLQFTLELNGNYSLPLPLPFFGGHTEFQDSDNENEPVPSSPGPGLEMKCIKFNSMHLIWQNLLIEYIY